MSSNPLMMDYGGGDLLLAGAAGCWVTAQAYVCRLWAVTNSSAWRLSFSDESALEVSVTQDVLDVLPLHRMLCEGVAHTLATVSWGRRWSIANSYLLPAMNRHNLHVAVGAHVNRVSELLCVLAVR